MKSRRNDDGMMAENAEYFLEAFEALSNDFTATAKDVARAAVAAEQAINKVSDVMVLVADILAEAKAINAYLRSLESI